MSTIAQIYGGDATYIRDDIFIAGLECEIESVRKYADNLPEFKPTEDGSLRNNGVEFISLPLGRDPLLTAFKNLHAKIEFKNKAEAFSPRTSTHVHVNCLALDEKQVKQIVLLYALFEEFFFAMVDSSRRGNIHCVPLTETFLPNYYQQTINTMIQRWHKYTALNILPLAKLGTIEFRHLQGTDNPELLSDWLRALENLWWVGQRTTIDETSLTDKSTIRRWFLDIFQHSSRIMALEPCLDDMIKNSLIDVKLSLVK